MADIPVEGRKHSGAAIAVAFLLFVLLAWWMIASGLSDDSGDLESGVGALTPAPRFLAHQEHG